MNEEIDEDFFIENNVLPTEGEIVVVKFQTVTDYGSKVTLLTHNNMEAFMPINEFSNRRLRSMNYTRVGKIDIMCVSRVDPRKNHIDVSKKQISEDDRINALNKFKKGAAVQAVLKFTNNLHLAMFLKNEANEKKIDTFELLKKYLLELIPFPPEIKDKSQFFTMCQKYMRIEKVDCRQNIYLFAYGIDAIDDIKEVLSCCKNYTIKLIYNTPPYYMLQGVNEIEIKTCLNEMMEKVKNISDLDFKILGGNIPEEVEPKNEFIFDEE